eukprot:CAMPEP_0180696036 /NCGR_PEP_ID=MMETSP1038_2-20121128/2764_1 /TAXON_ID=632150 /ORGANISM="Azadinium spinosum, Strain 3D9" /LENGTH=86 /DNA_ID=CAMNT_0022727487 /DNA_START=54 /DNA_END=314 /DNA_ORIENTATION=-
MDHREALHLHQAGFDVHHGCGAVPNRGQAPPYVCHRCLYDGQQQPVGYTSSSSRWPVRDGGDGAVATKSKRSRKGDRNEPNDRTKA